MFLSEADTKAKFVDPALHQRGWTEDFIRRERTECAIDIVDGKPRRRKSGRTDYILRVKVTSYSQPIAVALIEAKKESEHPGKGLEQAKRYARLNHVRFLYSTNGHLFIEYDDFAGKTSEPLPLSDFPTPSELRERYEQGLGFTLDNEHALPLCTFYSGGESIRRYYQDAAIRAVLERFAQGKKKVLITLATGSGKTHIAVHILKKIADAGQLRRALFVCDRDELRSQGLSAFQNVFGNDATPVSGSNPQKNARILIATYQTLNVSGENEDAKFLVENYPENYFSHIIIDECHRSAWGKWSIILKRNENAFQIGMTATPRYWECESKDERKQDDEITANNLTYFGEPVYQYDMAQGIEDGYLPACEIIRRITDLDERGITRKDIEKLGARDAITGQPLLVSETRARYDAPSYEAQIQLPDRVKAWCKDLFDMMLKTGGPHQKTVIFCARDTHADAVANEMNNLYSEWCIKNKQKRLDPYAFKCTASVGGSDYIADLRGSERSHFIATTVDLITTGVDVPILQNVVFFKFVNSPISFQQMLGRGARIHLPTNKLMFRVYDYTNATRLLGKEIKVRRAPETGSGKGGEKEKVIVVEGFSVHINPAGTYIVTNVEGRLGMVTIEEYRQMIASHLTKEIRNIDDFRDCWIDPQRRKELIQSLPDDGRGIRLLRELTLKQSYDLYDVLAEIGYGMLPKTRSERVTALQYKHGDWFKDLPSKTSLTLMSLAKQFERGGTDELENPHIFNAPEVFKSGGLNSLKILGEPKDIIQETKRRLFAS